MFTGIITDIGEVIAVRENTERRIDIATHYPLADITIGASIACDGVCLTVIETGTAPRPYFAAEVSQATLAATQIGTWQAGTRVNLERAARLGDELGGHLVTGHVDGLAQVDTIDVRGGSWSAAFRPSGPHMAQIAAKGSIALGGVSLTVNAVETERFWVNIIPHTLQHTTLGDLRVGASIHYEIDLIARYVARLLQR